MSVVELDIMASNDPNGTPLVTLTDADISAFEMRVGENELGGGGFTIRRDHPDATAANLAAGNYVKVTLPAVQAEPVFGFWLDEHNDTILSRNEEGGEFLTRAGPGTLAILGRAILLEQKYVDEQHSRGNYNVAGYWTWSSEPYGAILVRLIEEGQEEPGAPLADVTIDFTRSEDTDSDAWPNIEELIQVPIGTDGLSLYERLVASGHLYVRADPDLAIHGYGVSPGVDRTSGSFGVGKVRFLQGTNIETELVRSAKGVELATHAIVVGKDHVYRQVVSPTYAGGAGRWASVDYQASNDPDLLDAVGEEYLRRRESMMDTVELEILPGDTPGSGLYQPFKHFDVGDIVTLHTGSDPWDYNEYDARLAGFRIVLGVASKDDTVLEATRSLRVIVELNGSHTVGFTGHSDKGGCCPPSFPHVPVGGVGDCAPAAYNETAIAGASPGGHGHWMAAARPLCIGLAMRMTGTFTVEPTPGGFYTESASFLVSLNPAYDFSGGVGADPGGAEMAPSSTFGGGTVVAFDKVMAKNPGLTDWAWIDWADVGTDGWVLASPEDPLSGAAGATQWRTWRNGQWSPAVEADYQVRWYDPVSGDLEGSGNQPQFGQLVYEQIVSDGESLSHVTNYPYAQNSLVVTAGGVTIVVDQTDPDAGEFQLPTELPTGTLITLWYQAASATPTGASNTVPTSGGVAPYPYLGTGGDGSGGNVLHDDGVWRPLATSDDYQTTRYGEGDHLSVIAATGTTETIDLALGNVHYITLDDDCTLTFTGAPADGRARRFQLYVAQDSSGGHIVTWPGSVIWPGGITPTLDTTAETETLFVFETLGDGGATWRGFVIGGSNVGALDDLSDVVITTPVAGQRLRFNGSSWVNSSLKWKPVLALDPTTGIYINVHSGGDPVMAEG